jgi:hypothetical protein
LNEGRPAVLERKAVEEARKRIIQAYGVSKEEYLGNSIVPPEWLGQESELNEKEENRVK